MKKTAGLPGTFIVFKGIGKQASGVVGIIFNFFL
jgi:hypothetical protein